MRIITNPGSNLTSAIVARYDVDVTPQQIVVDGVLHDTRDSIPQEEIRELQSSIYLHCGPGALGAFVYPVDELGFAPHPPPRF